MTYEDGEVDPRDEDEWLQFILERGTDYWGEDITERDGQAIHRFYRPVAAALSELEEELQSVLRALRVRYAEGKALDYLGEEIGVPRLDAKRASGEVTFSRSTTADKDYLISSGTILQTTGVDPLEFVTTETVTLSSGTTSVTAPIEATATGAEYNVGSGSVVDSSPMPAGVETINNSSPISGGREKEADDNYRDRILDTVSDTNSASGFSLYQRLKQLQFVRSVSYIDSTADDNTGLNEQEVEVVVDADPGHNGDIAQTIFENIAMGANLVSGVHGSATSGTATLSNGQSFTIPFSEPTQVETYIEADITLESDVNEDKLKDEIVEYIGGTKSNGERVYGDLSVGEDVLIGEVEFQLRDYAGVYDVTTLNVGTSSPPSSTSNITISGTEQAATNAANITINKTIQ